MTRSRRKATDEPPRPRLALEQPRETVRERLEKQINLGAELQAREIANQAAFDEWRAEQKRWSAFTEEILSHAFNHDGPREEFARALNPPVYFMAIGDAPTPLSERIADDRKDLARAVNALRSIVERLELLDSPGGAQAEAGPLHRVVEGRRVFVVHGRDEGLRESVARVLDRLAFKPLILADQPNAGRTVIEKFEANALDVGFAVVILSSDDYARGPDEAEFSSEPNRARQNVVLELGYFMGKLGRSRVAALYKPGTELPSDIHGLAYVEIDDGGAWRFRVASELAAAGYDVDLNRLRSV